MEIGIVFDAWLNKAASNVKLRTYARYRGIGKDHILPYFGYKRPIGQITAHQLERMLAQLRAPRGGNPQQRIAIATENLVIAVLRGVFGYAHANQWIADNPALSLKRRKIPRRRIDVLTRDEQTRLVEFISAHTDIRYYPIVVGLYTGMRLGEILALRWDDVDWRERTLRVDKETYRVCGADGVWSSVVDTPKSVASIRTIPMCDRLRVMLERIGQDAPQGNIFRTQRGVLSVRMCQYLFGSVQKRCKIRVRNFHTLRHTFATRLLESGVDFKTLSELLGHENVEITMRIYAHTLMQTKRDAVQKLNDL